MSRLVVSDRPLDLDPKRVPLADGLVVACEDVSAPVIEAHPLDGYPGEHPEPQQIQPKSDSDHGRPAGLHMPSPACAALDRRQSASTRHPRPTKHLIRLSIAKSYGIAVHVPPPNACDFADFARSDG